MSLLKHLESCGSHFTGVSKLAGYNLKSSYSTYLRPLWIPAAHSCHSEHVDYFVLVHAVEWANKYLDHRDTSCLHSPLGYSFLNVV
jgi:hypothetical protein